MCENEVLREVNRRLDIVLTPDTRPNVQQLMRCFEPAIDRLTDLLAENKRLSAYGYFALSELREVQVKEKEIDDEIRKRKKRLMTDTGIQEPEVEQESSSDDDDDDRPDEKRKKQAARVRRAVRPGPGVEYQNGITDAAMLKFDPLSKPIPTPWRMKRGPRKKVL